MKITEYIKENILYLDGGMGTLLQERGLLPGELPERWNLTRSEVIKQIHLDYYNAGSNVVNANTFGANALKFSDEELEQIIKAAMDNARAAKEESDGCHEKWIALDIGPTGRMLKPYGDLDFEDAVSVFAKTVKFGVKYGADLIFIETMSDSYETKAAYLAAKENSELPIFVSNAFGEDGKLLTGASPCAMVSMLEGLRADAIGVNCSLGPKALFGVMREYLKSSSLPVIFKPNAGLPRTVCGKTVYDVSPREFAESVAELVKEGVRIVGGCCGTTPEHIKELCNATRNMHPCEIKDKNITSVSSYTHAVVFGNEPILIGERINPTGKKKFKEAILNKDIEYILKEGILQQEHGAHVLDVNVGLPGIDEAEMLTLAVCELQAIINLPLQIDTSDKKAMEAALRRYNGKAMINSVSGKKESMDAVFPLAKKYGGLIVALTLDENGIPEKAEGRVEIARKILEEAKKYGIGKKDIIFDTLAMAVSADASAARESLKALRLIKEELSANTSLGVSNISFGLPSRDMLNGAFFTLALENGLSAAIMNPYSSEMMKSYFSYKALSGMDESFEEYIAFAERFNQTVLSPSSEKKTESAICTGASELQYAIRKGMKERAAEITAVLIKTEDALSIVNNEIIPALNIVGEGFEKKEIYLPTLLMSAEAAKAAFEVIKSSVKSEKQKDGAKIVIATVKGDIHDIGKNIVKLILENYGFSVIDLGKDVAPESILEAVLNSHATMVGLSALMTTTVPAMEETIALLHKEAPHCKIIVGGAVLNKEYAEKIGADKYAKDAMEAVRYAQEIEKQ